MMLVLDDGKHASSFVKGACAPQFGPGRGSEEWTFLLPRWLPAGSYRLHALFYDASEAAWHGKLPPQDSTYILATLDLGWHDIAPATAWQ
jgi:hypothetical protein